MKKMSLVQWLLLLPALLLFLLCLGLTGLVLSYQPPVVSVVAVVVLGIIAAWFILRRRGAVGAVSEAGLIGRQSSKDGLL